MNTMIDLSLSRKELEQVSEISMDEWIERYNALAKEFGSCYGPNGVPCVSVRWFDKTAKTTRWFELDDIVAGEGDYNSVNSDMATLLDGKTITINDGSFELEVENRMFGLEFITTEGKKILAYTKSALVGTNYHVHSMGNKKQLEVCFLQFDNNPRRLGTKNIYGKYDDWDSDFPARLINIDGNEFCFMRVIQLTKEEIDTLLAHDEIPEQCKGCNWSNCPVFKKFNQK